MRQAAFITTRRTTASEECSEDASRTAAKMACFPEFCQVSVGRDLQFSRAEYRGVIFSGGSASQEKERKGEQKRLSSNEQPSRSSFLLCDLERGPDCAGSEAGQEISWPR